MADFKSSYIVAARRTAIGRVGGLHGSRRLDQLAAPTVAAALEDARVPGERVDELFIGNALQGGNPARLIALAAGLPEHVSAVTLDRQCASGLDAILAGCRQIELGEADVVVAGGAESLSTAPWRIAKPRSLHQLPHFISFEPGSATEDHEASNFEASEDLSRNLGISRDQQDAWAVKSHIKARAARDARRFIGEIVPLRANADEARDQGGLTEPTMEMFQKHLPFLQPDGTLTPGNTSAMHDGAAFVVIVSQAVWEELGKPPALRLMASAVQGVGPEAEAGAPIEVMKKLYSRLNGFNPKDIGIVEMSEASSAQAIALSASLGIDDDIINPDGGAIVRGHPFAAASAVLVVRLFTRMARGRTKNQAAANGSASMGEEPSGETAAEANLGAKYGVATVGAIGGLGLAALFEAV